MTGFETYLGSLLGSWEALAVPHADAKVIRHDQFLASVSPSHPVFNNAILLDHTAVDKVRKLYASAGPFAVWAGSAVTSGALSAQGFALAEATHPMVCRLGAFVDGESPIHVRVVADVPVEQIAALNNVNKDLLVGVPGVRAFATEGLEAGAVLIEVGGDVNVSFVATRPECRRRGLASGVLDFALRQAREAGFQTSSLQATTMAGGVYQRLGYVPVGTWQEWTPAPS
jgi:GNAT superfamily N-acetyltransferase